MFKESVMVIFCVPSKQMRKELEVPLNITANELVVALNEGYQLNIDVSNISNCFLKAEEPIALLRGNRTLGEFGIRNGTIITYL